MRMFWGVVSSLALVCVSFAADLPTPVRTKLTTHDLRKIALAFNRQTLADAYEKIGERDPKWDAATKAFLDRVALRWSDVVYADYYASDTDTSNDTMLKLADEASKLGCRDPLFVYCKAVMLKDSGDSEGFQTNLKRALPALLAGNYPPNRKYWAISQYEELPPNLRTLKLGGAGDNQTSWTFLIEYLRMPVIDPVERRIRVQLANDSFEKTPTSIRTSILKGVDAPTTDVWILHMLHGLDEVKLAWEARGGGYADTVQEEGWKGFRDHLTKAHDELVAAYTLEPTYPEAATSLIAVAMGDAAAPGESTRDWFDRAIAAQIDYMPAWSAYGWAVRPRWGGSHMQMYALGCEAMRTRRFDTAAPAFLFDMLQAIAHDTHTDYRFDLFSGVWPNVKSVFDGYLDKPFPDMEIDWWRSRELGFAYRCGQYRETLSLVDTLKDKASDVALADFDASIDEIATESRAMTSSVAADLKEALAYARGHDFTTAANLFAGIARKLKPDHPAWLYTLQQEYLSSISGSITDGKRADIPLAAVDDLIPWRGSKEGWQVNAEGLSFTSAQETSVSLRHLASIPPNVRIRVDWSFSSPPPHAPSFALMFQDIAERDNKPLAIIAYPHVDQVYLSTKRWSLPQGRIKGIKSAPDAWHTWMIEHIGNTVRLEQDGKEIMPKVTDDWIGHGAPMLGLCVSTPPEGGTVRVRNLSIEPIEVDPAP